MDRTDQELVIQVLDGSDRAFGELVDRYDRAVFNLTLRMLNDPAEAEDAAQEAFLKAFRYLRRYDQSRSFKTWLLSIASNHCIDRLRKRRFLKLPIEDMLAYHPALSSREPSPEEAVISQDRSDRMSALLEQLSPKYRAVIILHYWYDMTCSEIGQTLSIEEGTVKSRLFRARKKLAANIQTSSTFAPMMALESA